MFSNKMGQVFLFTLPRTVTFFVSVFHFDPTYTTILRARGAYGLCLATTPI